MNEAETRAEHIDPAWKAVGCRAIASRFRYAEQRLISMDTLTLDFSAIGIITPPGAIAVEVADGSMATDGIAAGDVVLVCNQPPHDGAVVAVDIEGQTVFRRFAVAGGVPMLRTDSSEAAEMPAARHTVLGVAVGLIRKLR